MSESDTILIFQKQIHSEYVHLLSIIDDELYIENKDISTCLIENNLYVMDIVGSSILTFLSINNDTVKTWHTQ